MRNLICQPFLVIIVYNSPNKLISNNTTNFGSINTTSACQSTKATQVVRVEKFSDFNKEVKWVAEDIMKQQVNSTDSFVVLARTNRLLAIVVEALNNYGVGGFMGVQKMEFDSEPMKWLHNILRLANSRNNHVYLRIVCDSFNAFEDINLDVESIVAQANAESGDYLRAWREEVLNSNNMSDTARNVVKTSLVSLIDHLNYRMFSSIAFKWLDSIYSDSNHEQQFNEYDEEKKAWVSITDEITVRSQSDTLNSFLQQLDHRHKNSNPPEGAVPCYTIHSSKGMEFDHVYLIGMVENYFPRWHAIKNGEKSEEMEEERRNCYVGVTRTQQTLTITHSEKTNGSITEASRFLYEMGLLS